MKTLTEKDIPRLKKLIGRAVVVKWKDPDSDWHHFRLENVVGESVCFTGMMDETEHHHVGDFFRTALQEIVSIKERI